MVLVYEPTSDAGKCGSLCQSTTSLSENVIVAKTSYQMLEILSFSDQERALPPSTEISVLTKVKLSSSLSLKLSNNNSAKTIIRMARGPKAVLR